MNLRTSALLALVGVGAVLTSSLPAQAKGYVGRDHFSFQDERITESSGVVASSRQDGIWFTHNDSGDLPRFFAVDERGCTQATFDLTGFDADAFKATHDVEDIARGPHGDTSSLWLADIGDNLHQRTEIAVHRVVEPLVAATDVCTSPTAHALAPTTFRLAYPDVPQDAETLLADPVSGQLFIVTKAPDLHSFVYAAPLELDASAVNVLQLVGSIVFQPTTTYDRDPATELGSLAEGSTQIGFDLTGRLWAVGGDIAPGRDRVVIRTYTDAWEWTIAPGASIAAVLTASVPTKVPLRYERQGEAIAYTRDGASLLTTCEDVRCIAHLYGGG